MTHQDASEGKYVYISYSPHELPEVAQRLKEDLEHLGYEVFLGAGQITAGGQWDAAQNEGLQRLKDGGWFIYLMTPSSVRQGQNFCLNEVTWAVHHFTGALLPLMVKPCKPPLSIYHIHYYSIDDCIPIKDKEECYREHLKEIQAILERRKPIPIPDERFKLERILRPMAFDWKKLTALDSFSGREWALEKAKEWVENPNAPRIFRIGGGPGTGKSAIAAWLVREMPELIQAIHFCDRDNVEKSNVNRIIHSIACQLAFCLEDYRRELEHKVYENVEDNRRYLNPMIQPRVLFEELIVDPLFRTLKTHRNDNQQIVILIDGLDEAGAPGMENELARLIGDPSFQDAMPGWIRWIITSRNEPLITSQLHGAPIQIDLDEVENQRADFRAYFEKRLSGLLPEQKRESILETLVNRAEKSFLYCELLCDDIERDPQALRSPEKFPEGMNGYLSQFFSAHYPQGFDDRTRDVLSLMCAVVEPLDADLIRKITGMKKPELKKWLRAVGFLVQYEEKTETLRFYHAIVKEWLTRELEGSHPDIYAIEPEKGHRMLADYGWDNLQKKQGCKKPMDYVIENLGIHLYASSNKPEKDKRVRDRLLELFRKSFTGTEKGRLPVKVIDALLTYVVAHHKESEETGFKGIVGRFLRAETPPGAKYALANFLHPRYDYDSERGNLEWARWMLQRQHPVLKEHVKAYPEGAKRQWELGVSWFKIGDIEAAKGNLDLAHKAYNKGLVTKLELIKKIRFNTVWLWDLSVSWNKIGDIEAAQGNLDYAVVAYEKGQDVLLELSENDPEDTDWLQDLCMNWNKIGDLEAKRVNLGQALEAYKKGQDILLDLTEKDPANTLWQLVRGGNLSKIAEIEAAQGNLSQALENFKKTLAIMLELTAKDPTNTFWLYNLTFNWERIGDIEERLGNLDSAKNAYEKALEIRLDLTAKEPANTDWQLSLGVNWNKIGDVEEARGNLDLALEAYEKGLEIIIDLTEKDPTNTLWQRVLHASQNRIGDIEEARGNTDQALKAYEKDLANKLELAAEDPENTDWLWDLSASWSKIGDLEEARGNLSQALKAYTKSLETNLVLTEKDPENTLWLRDLSMCWNKIGDVETARGNLSQAQNAYEKALAIALDLTEKDPTNTDWLLDLSIRWNRIGNLENMRENLPQARAAYEQELRIMLELTAKDPENTEWLRDLSVSWRKIGDIEASWENVSQAQDAYKKALTILRKLIKKDPTNIRWLRDLSKIWSKIGDIESARGNLAQAQKACEKTLAILLELTAKDPVNTDWLLDLGVSWTKVGDVERKLGKLSQARDAYEKALAIMLELTNKDPENTGWQHVYGISLSRLGILHERRGDSKRAKECFLKVLELHRSLVDRAPNEIDFSIGLVYALLDLSSVVKNVAEKRKYWKEAYGITKSLVEAGVEHYELEDLKEIFGIE